MCEAALRRVAVAATHTVCALLASLAPTAGPPHPCRSAAAATTAPLPSPDAPSHPLCLPLCRTCEGSRRYEPFVVGMQLPPGEGAALIGVHLLKFQLEFAGFLCVGGKSEQVSK